MGYNLDGENIKIGSKYMRRIGQGKTGDVYKIDQDTAIKVFKDEKNTPIDENTADKLSKISTDRIILPKSLLFYNDAFIGYTYRLISKIGSGKRIIMLPKSDLIQDIRILESDIEELSNKQVLLSGIEPTNTIFNGNLYITDPSGYSMLEDINTKNLEQLNNYQLHLLLVKLISMDLRNINFSTKANIDAIEAMLKGKDKDETSSEFFSEIISGNDSIKDFVKKIH